MKPALIGALLASAAVAAFVLGFGLTEIAPETPNMSGSQETAGAPISEGGTATN